MHIRIRVLEQARKHAHTDTHARTYAHADMHALSHTHTFTHCTEVCR